MDDIYVRQRVSHLRQTKGSNRTIVSTITSSSVIASVVKHAVLLFREHFSVRVPIEIVGHQLEFVKVVQFPSGRFSVFGLAGTNEYHELKVENEYPHEQNKLNGFRRLRERIEIRGTHQ